jgi:hypothetical protein
MGQPLQVGEEQAVLSLLLQLHPGAGHSEGMGSSMCLQTGQ